MRLSRGVFRQTGSRRRYVARNDRVDVRGALTAIIWARTNPDVRPYGKEASMIRKLPSGGYRLYSSKVDPKTGKRRNLGTFKTREQAEKREREIQYFKHR